MLRIKMYSHSFSRQMQSQPSTSPLTNHCRNHPTVPSRFFLLEQPQARYCKSCALNMALCGRKVERELTAQQYERKLLLDAVVGRLKSNINEVEANQAYYEQLLSMVDLSAIGIARKMEAIDAFIRRLTEVKFELERQFQSEIQAKRKAFLARKEELNDNNASIRQQIENIESNFGSIIEEEDQEQFNGFKTVWNELMGKTGKELLTEVQFSFERNKISESVASIQRQLKDVAKMRVLDLLPPLISAQEKENRAGEDADGFNCQRLVEELKLNLAVIAQSKTKCNTKRSATERQSTLPAKKGKFFKKDPVDALPSSRKYNH